MMTPDSRRHGRLDILSLKKQYATDPFLLHLLLTYLSAASLHILLKPAF